jgi:nucleotide-binding universal stress UspA family protein
LVGIHVLEEPHVRAASRYHALEELQSVAEEAAGSIIARAGAEQHFAELRVVQGQTANESLETARVDHRAHAIILGRHAAREGRYMTRLGRVARRVLRTLSSPVIVVPPDLDPAEQDGPVVAACDLAAGAETGVSFAADMATRLGRPLLLLHVVPTPDDYGVHYLPEASLEQIRRENQEEGERALAEFAARENLDDAGRLVVQGGVTNRLVQVASERRACLITTGSRHLSGLERLLLTSIGSDLAGAATCAVAVVPPANG